MPRNKMQVAGHKVQDTRFAEMTYPLPRASAQGKEFNPYNPRGSKFSWCN